MNTRLLAVALGATLLLPIVASAYDPVVTSNTLITDERRLALLEGKIASLQKQLDLVEDARAVERLQQAWGHYVSEGLAHESGTGAGPSEAP